MRPSWYQKNAYLGFFIYVFALVVSLFHIAQFFILFEKGTGWRYAVVATSFSIALEAVLVYYNYLRIADPGVMARGLAGYRTVWFLIWFANGAIMYRNFRVKVPTFGTLLPPLSFVDKNPLLREGILGAIGLIASLALVIMTSSLGQVIGYLVNRKAALEEQERRRREMAKKERQKQALLKRLGIKEEEDELEEIRRRVEAYRE